MAGVFKNNLSISPTIAHWWIQAYDNQNYSDLSISNNLYYPDGNLFVYWYLGSPLGFSGWQRKLTSIGVVGADMNSLSNDPFLSNGSGTYSLASDFRPTPDSPVINKGDNSAWSGKPRIVDYTGSTGITSDSGAIIAPGGVVDIGAHEAGTTGLSSPRNLRVTGF